MCLILSRSSPRLAEINISEEAVRSQTSDQIREIILVGKAKILSRKVYKLVWPLGTGRHYTGRWSKNSQIVYKLVRPPGSRRGDPGSRIQHIFAFRIRNPGLWNPESRLWNPQYNLSYNPESFGSKLLIYDFIVTEKEILLIKETFSVLF